MKPRCIFVMDEEHFAPLFGPDELSRLSQLVSLTESVVPGGMLEANPAPYGETELMIGSWGMPTLDTHLLQRLPRLRAVFYAAGTVKGIVTNASWERGIRITHAAVENAKPTAEFAVAEIVLSLKRAWERIFLLRENRRFMQRDPLLRGCYGSTVGLLALGKIGRLVAEKLQAMDVQVIAYDPFVTPMEAAHLGVRLGSIQEVFAAADVVSCHLPSTPQTHRLIDEKLLRSMKPGATFINTARGCVVHEPELIKVLHERPDLYAVLDVTEQEPPRSDNPLFSLKNVVLTPHIAGSMGTECRRLGKMMVDEVKRYLAGQPLQGEVLRDQLEILA